MTKRCYKCRETLPLCDFNKDHARYDGLQSVCRKCGKVLVSEYRLSGAGRIAHAKHAAKDPERFNRISAENQQRYRARNPEKTKARKAFWYAVKSGRITRPESCSKCDTACKPEGHHDDYNKPFEVAWLCEDCHTAIHRKELVA